MAAIALKKLKSGRNGLVMSGHLYYKSKRMSLSRKYWVELHRETSNHPRELQLFSPKENAGNSNMIVESIMLTNILEICDKKRTISGRPMFEIIAMKAKYQLCAVNNEELERWVTIIQHELFGLPQAGITYEYVVMVIENPSAKKYSLVGKYTMKIDDKNIMLYSANGLIPTNFLVRITNVWRVKLAPSSEKDSVYSNFVVLDFTGGGVLLLMSQSSTDIARVLGHRRRLLSGYNHSDTTGDIFHSPFHGSPDLRNHKSKTNPTPPIDCIKPGLHLSASYEHYGSQHNIFKFQLSIEDNEKAFLHFASNISLLRNGRSHHLQISHVSERKLVIDSPTVINHRNGSISRRPPEPVPRSQNSLQKPLFDHMHDQDSSLLSTLPKLSESDVDDDDADYTLIPGNDVNCSNKRMERNRCNSDYLEVFSDDDSHSDQNLYNYAYEDNRQSISDDIYYICDDQILELRRNDKHKGRNTSIKGSKSMENLLI